jgi:hypothetical protein
MHSCLFLLNLQVSCSEWQKKALSPEPGSEVIFLDTSSAISKECNVANEFEAEIIISLVKILAHVSKR